MKPTLAVLSLTTLLITGCVPMMIMNSFDHDNYLKYVQTTNQLNTDREKSGLEPVRVIPFDEWRGQKRF